MLYNFGQPGGAPILIEVGSSHDSRYPESSKDETSKRPSPKKSTAGELLKQKRQNQINQQQDVLLNRGFQTAAQGEQQDPLVGLRLLLNRMIPNGMLPGLMQQSPLDKHYSVMGKQQIFNPNGYQDILSRMRQ